MNRPAHDECSAVNHVSGRNVPGVIAKLGDYIQIGTVNNLTREMAPHLVQLLSVSHPSAINGARNQSSVAPRPLRGMVALPIGSPARQALIGIYFRGPECRSLSRPRSSSSYTWCRQRSRSFYRVFQGGNRRRTPLAMLYRERHDAHAPIRGRPNRAWGRAPRPGIRVPIRVACRAAGCPNLPHSRSGRGASSRAARAVRRPGVAGCLIAAAGVLMQITFGAGLRWSVFRIPLPQTRAWMIAEVTVALELAIFVLGPPAFAGDCG